MSMTTVELFHRIGRRARGGDFTRLSMSEQSDLMQAANVALQTLYGLLPNAYKEQTQGFVLPAPATVSLAVTQYSQTVAASSFTAAQIGRSIVLPGDGNWNQIIDTDKLLNPYMGASGTVSATVYGDAFYSTDYPLDRIVGNPRFPSGGSATVLNRELIPVSNPSSWNWLSQQTTGTPQFWWTQSIGFSQGKEPIIVFRVMPAPTSAYALSVRISYWPKRLTLADYTDAARVPVPDQFIDTVLVPLALQALMATPVWDGKGDDKKIDAQAADARRFIQLQAPQLGPVANRIFTPLGY